MKVFWKSGYEGASLDDLTSAMGINRPSLYAAFGNKEALFKKVVERYGEKSGEVFCTALNQPTARGVVEQLLRRGLPKKSSGQSRGCLLVQSALAGSQESDAVRCDLVKRMGAIELQLRERFERALAEGDLPKAESPAALAKYIVTLQNGLAVQLSSGASVASLRNAIEIVLRGWPSR